MRIAQIGKRIFLFGLVNILVVLTITIVLGLLRVGNYFPAGGLAGLAVFCLVWGFAGAFISLALSRIMAKWMSGVRLIPPDTTDPTLRALLETVYGLARQAGLPRLPEVGIYQSDEVNAFATGPSRSRALVAVSSGLLQRMNQPEIEGVLGHEVTHIANGDMVTMTLVQGVINAFVLFLARVLAFVVGQALTARDDRREGGGWLEYLLVMVFQVVFSILGMVVVAWFSRRREFRADAGGARLAGRGKMINALRALEQLYEPEAAVAAARQAQGFQALKISNRAGALASLFATHPPIEQRIARLEQGGM